MNWRPINLGNALLTAGINQGPGPRYSVQPPSTPFSYGTPTGKYDGLAKGISSFGNAFFGEKERLEDKAERKELRDQQRADKLEEREYQRARNAKSDARAEKTLEIQSARLFQNSDEYKRKVKMKSAQELFPGDTEEDALKRARFVAGEDYADIMGKNDKEGSEASGTGRLYSVKVGDKEYGQIMVRQDKYGGKAHRTWVDPRMEGQPVPKDATLTLVDTQKALGGGYFIGKDGQVLNAREAASAGANWKGRQSAVSAWEEKGRVEAQKKIDAARTDKSTMKRLVGEIRAKVPGNVGRDSWKAWIAGNEAQELHGLIGTMKARIGMRELAEIKGKGISLGPITDAEHQIMQALQGDFNMFQNKKAFMHKLDWLLKKYEEIDRVASAEYKRKNAMYKSWSEGKEYAGTDTDGFVTKPESNQKWDGSLNEDALK